VPLEELADTVEFPITATIREEVRFVHSLWSTPFGPLRHPKHRTGVVTARYWYHQYLFELTPSIKVLRKSQGLVHNLRATIARDCDPDIEEAAPDSYYALEREEQRKRVRESAISEAFNCYTVYPSNRLSTYHEPGRVSFGDITYYRYLYETLPVKRNKGLVTVSNVFPVYRVQRDFGNQVLQTRVGGHQYIGRQLANCYRCSTVTHLDYAEAFERIAYDFQYPPHVYRFDTTALKKRKYLPNNPPVVDYPVHPFSVDWDFPYLLNRARSGTLLRVGIFELGWVEQPWMRKPSSYRSSEDKKGIRNWIFGKLIESWVTGTVNTVPQFCTVP
jgi:hypothetical protein